MQRIFLSLSAAALLIGAATASAGAESPVGGSYQTVTSPVGYKYQIPADWQKLPTHSQQQMGSQTFNVDGAVASADGAEQAHVEAATGFGYRAADLLNVLASFFAGPPNPPPGMPTPSVLVAPTAVQVAGADAAVSGAMAYADPSGNQRVVAARAALQGQTTYILAVDVPQAFYQSDPNFAQIMSSFQLTPSVSVAVEP